MKRVAIVGANGFIGARAVEMMQLSGVLEPRPVVRRASAAALARRFDLDVRVADGFDVHALAEAFRGCDGVISAIAGDPQTIVGVVGPLYRAAEKAGVKRLVYLSTASVHGQSPAAGTNESSPLSKRQPIHYNNAKVRAERRLGSLRRSGAVETVVLRPGIVYGPRSQWIGGWADELMSGTAYLVEGGRGVCNAIYVDNLVHATVLALAAEGVDGRAYLVGDQEEVIWRDLLGPVTTALGLSLDMVPDRSAADAPRSPARRWEPSQSQAVRRLARLLLPRPARDGLRAAYAAAFADDGAGPPPVSLERALLHTCSTRLPWERARQELGYSPPTSFAEGIRRSIAWLEFAGYPVVRA
jgi:2-alkyl-3-oxoalkanoate reductase